jgi:hypothetical protein
MALPAHVDLDKLISVLMDCTKSALNGWLAGVPRDETAFINRLTSQLGKTRRGCDVGLSRRVVAHARVAELHRRAGDSSDLFGSDLAVTVFIEPGDYAKTAMIQMKKGSGFSAQLERRQIEHATASEDIRERSFVVYIDDSRPGIRIAKAKDLIGDWSHSQKTKIFNVEKWTPLIEWATKWLSCETGPTSPKGGGPIEERLSRHDPFRGPKDTVKSGIDSAFAWLMLALQPEGLDINGQPYAHFFRR